MNKTCTKFEEYLVVVISIYGVFIKKNLNVPPFSGLVTTWPLGQKQTIQKRTQTSRRTLSIFLYKIRSRTIMPNAANMYFSGPANRKTASTAHAFTGCLSTENVPEALYTASCVCGFALIGWCCPSSPRPPLVADIHPEVQPPHSSSFQEEAELRPLARAVPLTWQHLTQILQHLVAFQVTFFYVVNGRPDQPSIPVWDQKIWTGQREVGSICGAFWRCSAALVSHKR